ncbi:conjugal transfer protein TrbC [Actinomadura rayongensis]|uniref:Conjugal transfer protein TrbC n=1 Tax=Actinomadura rayongensis TaxID=1429076 RepID=A0A6I4WA84_9ACTN|nr:conjugal transfer protein TrbC [Actinomadura rayongensis]MXQ65640.1 conjugal transfer protein TrbC [Actinomadura rayongensis]
MQEDLQKVLGLGLWTATGTCILSLLLVAGHMAITHRRGEGGEHVQGLKWVAAGCLLAGSASLIAKAVVF